MSGSQLAVYYQHSDQASQSSFQLSASSGGAQDFHVNCSLKLSGKMTCKKAPLFSSDCSMSTGNRKEPGYTGIPITARIFFPAFVFSNNKNHTIQLGYQNTILKGWTPPTRKTAGIALPFGIPVTDPLHHHHLICWSSPTQRHWTAQGMLCPICHGLSVYFW